MSEIFSLFKKTKPLKNDKNEKILFCNVPRNDFYIESKTFLSKSNIEYLLCIPLTSPEYQ